MYIVVVGQYGKVSNFENDAQMFAWYLKSDDRQLNYRLVLSNGTDYGVEKLCEKYTVVHSIKEWLDLWRNGTNVTNTIISTSPAIYAYEQNALPDNAFNLFPFSAGQLPFSLCGGGCPRLCCLFF